MKTNRLQRHICDFIIEQVEWWRDSNDINSPTHFSDLESRLNDIVEDEGWISDLQAYELDVYLTNLLVAIRNLKEE